MSENVKFISIIAIAFIVIIPLGYFGFFLQRKIHWHLSYDSMVNEAIEERIVPLENRIQELENAQKEKQIKN